jgi:hypothetical protein
MSNLMTTEGYIFLIMAWGTVIGVLTFCLYKVFSINNETGKQQKEAKN